MGPTVAQPRHDGAVGLAPQNSHRKTGLTGIRPKVARGGTLGVRPLGPHGFPLPRARPTLRGSEAGHRMTTDERTAGGALYAAISNAIVGFVHDYTGRGPTRARTSIRDDVVVVILQETMLKAERSLVADDKAELVAHMRRSFQQTMRADMSAAITELTGREVIAFMSDSHLEPDYSVEVFVLAPERRSG